MYIYTGLLDSDLFFVILYIYPIYIRYLMSFHVVTRITRVDLPNLLPFMFHYLEHMEVDSLFLLVMFSDPENYEYFVTRVSHPLLLKYRSKIKPIRVPESHLSMEPDHVLKSVIMEHILSGPLVSSFHRHFKDSNDWLLSIDSDEYLYLHDGKNFKQFLFSLPRVITQVQIPWVMIENTSLFSSSHPYHDIATLPWYKNRHVKSCSRIHNALRPLYSHYSTCHPQSKTWVSHQVIPTKQTAPYYDESTLSFDSMSPVLFHLHTGSLTTTLNKILYHNFAGKSDGSQKQLLHQALESRDPDRIRQLSKIQLVFHHTPSSHLLTKFPVPNLSYLTNLGGNHINYSKDIVFDVSKEKSLATARIDIESYAWFLDTAFKIFA